MTKKKTKPARFHRHTSLERKLNISYIGRSHMLSAHRAAEPVAVWQVLAQRDGTGISAADEKRSVAEERARMLLGATLTEWKAAKVRYAKVVVRDKRSVSRQPRDPFVCVRGDVKTVPKGVRIYVTAYGKNRPRVQAALTAALKTLGGGKIETNRFRRSP